VALAPLTTFALAVGAIFIDALTEDAVLESIRFAKEKNLPVFILGGGSNLLIADSGFPGLVIKVGIIGRESESDRGKTIVRVGAGEEWDRLVAWCVERDLAGVES
jgi:UDP-N-acetylmuramate dehydrogenase